MVCLLDSWLWLAVFTHSPDDRQRSAELRFLTFNSKLNVFKTFIFEVFIDIFSGVVTLIKR